MLKQKDLNEKYLQEDNLDEIFKKFDEEMQVKFAGEGQTVKKENQNTLSYEKEMEIREDARKIFDFFALIAPTHVQNGFHYPIYIKAVERTRSGSKWSQGFNIFQLNEESLAQFTEFLLDKERKKQKCCIYYSCYEYDFHKKVNHTRINRNGEKYECLGKPCQILKSNVVGTQYLVLDFDNYYKKDTEKIYEMLLNCGIETILVGSGHGQQMIFLLDGYSNDPTMLKQLVEAMKSSNFDIDESCTDITRVFRLPFTFNNKCYDLTKYMHYQRPERTSIEHSTNKRYSFETIIKTIQNLDGSSIPTILKNAKDIKKKKNADVKKIVAKPVSKKKKETNELNIVSEGYYKKMYSELNYDTLPNAVKNILRGVRDGFRNKSLLFLVPSFKNYYRFTLEQSVDILNKWNLECDPPLETSFFEKEVERIWTYEFDALYGKYDAEMENEFGSLHMTGFYVEKDDETIINNSLFDKIATLDNSSLDMYLAIKLLEKENGRYAFEQAEIMERMGISKSTFLRSSKHLVKAKLVNKKKAKSRRNNDVHTYSINTLNNQKTFTRVPDATIELMLMSKLSKKEIAFYLFLRKESWSNNENDIFISRAKIAEQIGCDETNITKISDKLHKKRFIRKMVMQDGTKTKVVYKIIK